MTQDANDLMMGGGAKSAKFDKIGAKVSGVIEGTPQPRQRRDIKDGKPLTWNDGSPQMHVVVILKTEAKDDGDDDGRRALFVKIPSDMQKAIAKAVKEAGASGLQNGGKLAVKYIKDGEQKTKGFNAPKMYAAKYEAPDPLAVAAAETQASEPEESLDDF